MKITLIHLSDIHFRMNWEENQGIVLDAFFKDLSKQIKLNPSSKYFLVSSGDFVFTGSDKEQYNSFINQFDSELNKLDISKSQRICVPGNHDVSGEYVKEKFIEHEGVVKLGLEEQQFNDYVSKTSNIFIDKFNNYNAFESKFSEMGMSKKTISGYGWNFNDSIGIYCLNTAICSSGGINQINDKNRLAIDTRSMQKWIQECNAKIKILIMHHPKEWLIGWAQCELDKLLKKSFSLCLSGHNHDQSIYHSINKEASLVECSAPPLFTNKNNKLGYALISVNSNGVSDIQYRQWTKNHSFVSGVDYSDTDDGKVIINKEVIISKSGCNDNYGKMLELKFNEALRSFSIQPLVWVEPILSKTNEISEKNENDSENKVRLNDFIKNPKSTTIKAPPQFGLTCLAHYMIKEAWNTSASLWIYLDSKSIELHSIEKAINIELDKCNFKKEDINCIILDSWLNSEKDALKILRKLCASNINTPIIVMQTIDEAKFIGVADNEPLDREFDVLYLLALSRTHIRKVVSDYNDNKHIGDENTVITKVVSDLEALNMHRTPLNCLTLLKVSESFFDDSPVNRTEMLEKVMFILFNMDEIPKYKSRPDLKDCSYVLGRFSEKMIRSNLFLFSRDYFLRELKLFCDEQFIDLEVDVVFDVLHINNIIIKRNNQYCFRYSYWVFFFAANRMHHDNEFAKFILEEKRYVSFPEIIEFYTGIDRRRDEALKILIKDIRETSNIVNKKVGLPEGMNPYRLINWNPSPENILKMKNEISDNVLNSNLPDEVKDQHADNYYDKVRPYNQSIHSIFQEYSVVILMQSIKASSRALRNSDFVSPEIRRELLFEIINGWEQISKVLLGLTPLLAIKGNAAFEGAAFTLFGNFGETLDNRVNTILQNIPFNVVQWFKSDLFSHKMGPLLYDQIKNEQNDLKRHELMILIVNERPRNWISHVQNYIGSISKNSFFLFDLFQNLRSQYTYGFITPKTRHDIADLIKMCFAKHELGGIIPGKAAINKIPDSILP